MLPNEGNYKITGHAAVVIEPFERDWRYTWAV